MDNEIVTDKKDRFLQQKLNKLKPKFTLLMKGFSAKDDKQLQLKEQHYLSIQEIQHLLMACFIPGSRLPLKPDWFRLERSAKAEKVGIFILDFDTKDIPLSRCAKETVRFQVEPGWLDKLLSTNLSRRVTEKINNDRSLMKTIEEQEKEANEDWKKCKKLTRLDLLLSPAQMLEEGILFPNPMSPIKNTTRKSYLPVTENSPMFALDCEMVQGVKDPKLLARVSIVDEHYNLVLDTLVKPEEKIRNYVTRYSGITKEMLDPVDITLADVKKILKKVIPRDAILCGQSLSNDLIALKTFHPYIIDTSVIYNLTGLRAVKTGLAALSGNFLGETIQNSRSGHCSIEDARATMKLVNHKLDKNLCYADAVLDSRLVSSKTMIPLSSFFHLYEADVKVYHDFISTENTNRFISVLTRWKPKVAAEMGSLVLNPKNICIIITKEGYCYINI